MTIQRGLVEELGMAEDEDHTVLYRSLRSGLIDSQVADGATATLKKGLQSKFSFSSRCCERLQSIRDLLEELENRLILDPDEGDVKELDDFVNHVAPNLRPLYERLESALPAPKSKRIQLPWRPVEVPLNIKEHIAKELLKASWDQAQNFLEHLGQDNGVSLTQSHMHRLSEQKDHKSRVVDGLRKFENLTRSRGVYEDDESLLSDILTCLRSTGFKKLANDIRKMEWQ